MQNIKSLQWAFQVSGLWLGLLGISALFPSIASRVFSMQILNVGLASELGSVSLATAFIAFICATDTKRYGPIWMPFALGFGLDLLVNIFYLINGHYSLSNSLPNLILNPILVIWLWLSRPLEG